MKRKNRNKLFVAIVIVLTAAALVLSVWPLVMLTKDAVTALLRSWGVLPGIEQVMSNALHVLIVVLAVTLPLSMLITIWMFKNVHGRMLRRMQTFMHGFARVPAVLLGLIGHVVIGESFALHQSVYTMSAMLAVLAVPFMVARIDAALRAVPDKYVLAGEALGGERMDILRMIVLPKAMPRIMRGVLELVERIVCECTALLVLMGTVMPDQLLATELFRLAWLGRKDAAVLAFGLMAAMMLIRLLTLRRWRSEGGEENCRYNWW